MQLCVLFAIITSLVATDLASDGPVVFLWHKLAAVLLAQALVVIAAWGIAARTVADVQCQHLPEQRIRERLDFGHRLHTCVWICISALVLSVFQWPRIVSGAFGKSILLDEVAAVTPILLPLIVSWWFLYEAERVMMGNAVKHSRWAYVTRHVRYYLLLPLMPLLVVLGFSDLFEFVLPRFAASRSAVIVRGAPLVAVFLGFPVLIRVLWRAVPLAAGELRSQLQAKMRDLGFQVRDILVWHTDSRSMNAAVCGVLPRWRYVLLTDRLVDELSPGQVEMLFLHEIGHAQLRHSLKLMAATTATLGTGILFIAPMFASMGDRVEAVGNLHALVLMAVILLSFLLVGRYARLLELEADLWAASRSRLDVAEYLQALAIVSGGSDPHRPSWLHPSFARRCDFLLPGLKPAAAWLRCRLRVATALLIGTVACILAYAAIY